MGQKVHPRGLRIGITNTWDSRWFANKKSYPVLLREDKTIREIVDCWDFRNNKPGSPKTKAMTGAVRFASVARIEIERAGKDIHMTVHTAKPAIVIGRKGVGIEALRKHLEQVLDRRVQINVEEIRSMDMNASLVAESIAGAIERRMSYRRAMKQAMSRALRAGAEGVKVCCGGRLGGTEIARSEWYREGRVPLHTLRADIDYANTTANTTYGTVGVKVWIYKGEVLPEKLLKKQQALKELQHQKPAAGEVETDAGA